MCWMGVLGGCLRLVGHQFWVGGDEGVLGVDQLAGARSLLPTEAIDMETLCVLEFVTAGP